MDQTPFRFLWDSESAVLYFFILSGFVLTESLIKSQFCKNESGNFKFSPLFYLKFAGKRIFRIYPAFITILILSWLFYSFFNNPNTRWIKIYWHSDFSFIDILKQAILIVRLPNDPALRLMPHDWTLSIEIMISLILPLMVLIARLRSWIMIMLTYILVKTLPIDSFVFDFSLGIAICCEKDFIKKVWKNIGILGQGFLTIFAVTLTQTQLLLSEFSKKIDLILIHPKSIGLSILLIALISSEKIQIFFLHKGLQIHGYISYSFYLVHLFVIGIIFKMYPQLGIIPALIMVHTFTFIIAALSFYFIEKPMIKAGKMLFGKD